ncbi:gluzincin family metallopeptidase [Alicyclobacillus dauci]|uniref:Peptidase MA superfamily protein n=1 Tax=Alicyclobacillus dauci TaxID=1475485 RepID=A0ABY6Z4I1_9BACL|nr:hypothetical protein [Alicyclobacillus dauci]WAH37674.1 hypothetical protein NZD86_03945 [Alicyclobacillus dauci]
MKKTPDKVFHISIGIIALFVTVVSVLSIIYQSLSPAISRFVTTSHVWSGLQARTSFLGGTAQTITNAHATQVEATKDGTPVSTSSKDDDMLKKIHVESFGSGVTSKDIDHVKSLLKDVNSPGLVSQTLGLKLIRPVTIRLVQNADSYQKALMQLGVNPAQSSSLSRDTGGFTQNDTVLIPLNQNQNDPDLVNTLTHELTHAFLNQNVGSLPSWINEGIAVSMGMQGQKRVESAATFSGYQRQLAENILDVTKSNQLQSLTPDENAILSGSSSYDYELQDWLAMSDLIKNHGIKSLQRYLNLLTRHMAQDQAFIVAFGEREDIFNQQFTSLLKEASQTRDMGVQFQMTIANAYNGNLDFLQHGADAWQGVWAAPGSYTVKLSADGQVTSSLSPVAPVEDTNPIDKETVYVALMPKTSQYWKGQKVADCGFAFDAHDGLYAFENTWVTLVNGQTVYLSTPTLFGVGVDAVQELNQQNPILPLFSVV